MSEPFLNIQCLVHCLDTTKHIWLLISHNHYWKHFLWLLKVSNSSKCTPALTCASPYLFNCHITLFDHLTQMQVCLSFLWVVCFLLWSSVSALFLYEGCFFDWVGHVVGYNNIWHILNTYFKSSDQFSYILHLYICTPCYLLFNFKIMTCYEEVFIYSAHCILCLVKAQWI